MNRPSGQIGNFIRHKCPNPEVGMGATILSYTDRTAATIVSVNKSGKTIEITRDEATRVDDNGMSESQKYEFKTKPDAPKVKVRLRKDGQWRILKDGRKVIVGHREKYHDFSF